jgi:hypothetical protein
MSVTGNHHSKTAKIRGFHLAHNMLLRLNRLTAGVDRAKSLNIYRKEKMRLVHCLLASCRCVTNTNSIQPVQAQWNIMMPEINLQQSMLNLSYCCHLMLSNDNSNSNLVQSDF